MARPGESSFISHTRPGPRLSPLGPLKVSMRPPACLMRSDSLGRLGLWSSESEDILIPVLGE